MDTLPSVEAMIMLLPEDDLPKSFEISTVMVSMLPLNFSSQFFMKNCSLAGLNVGSIID
jgi:hypothetical protein